MLFKRLDRQWSAVLTASELSDIVCVNLATLLNLKFETTLNHDGTQAEGPALSACPVAYISRALAATYSRRSCAT